MRRRFRINGLIRRFLCVWLKDTEEKTAQEIAGQVGFHWRHVQRIQQQVRNNGLEALRPAYKGGGRQLLSTERETEILNSLEKSTTAQPIVEAVSQAVGRPVGSSTVYHMLQRHGWKAKRPRPQHPQADLEAQSLFKKLPETLKKIINTTEKPVRLFFQDEGRFGRISQLRRCWTPKGKRAVMPAQHIRQYSYAFAAIEPATGETVSLILPEVSGQTMSLFLSEVASRYPGEQLVMVLDGAGWHKSRDLLIPEGVKLVFLPPYSPELNPIEQLWKGMRAKWFANRLFENMDALEDTLVEALKWVESSLNWVRSFSLYHWIEYALLN